MKIRGISQNVPDATEPDPEPFDRGRVCGDVIVTVGRACSRGHSVVCGQSN